MRRAILADEAGPVQAEHNWKLLEPYVMLHLVISALEKGRIDGDYGPRVSTGHSRRKRHRMFFGQSDIVKSGRNFLPENIGARSFRHRRRDAADARILFGQLNE